MRPSNPAQRRAVPCLMPVTLASTPTTGNDKKRLLSPTSSRGGFAADHLAMQQFSGAWQIQGATVSAGASWPAPEQPRFKPARRYLWENSVGAFANAPARKTMAWLPSTSLAVMNNSLVPGLIAMLDV